MGKRSQRRPVRYEKDQAGCTWGLIGVFDFSYGRSARNLLLDRRRASRQAVGAGYSRTEPKVLTSSNKKYQSIKDSEESESKTATMDVVKTSVKQLMEEEMFSEQGSKKHMNSAQVEPEQFDLEHGGHLRKNRKRTNKTCTKSCDMHVFEQKTSNIDLEIITEELCQIHQKSTSCVKCNQAYSLVGEKLSAEIKAFLNKRFTNGEHLIEDGKANHSKEFMDTLQTLSSNKELFLKLLQDPNSLLVKHVLGVEDDARLEEDQNTNCLQEETNNSKPGTCLHGKRRSFFRRKSNSQESISLKGNEKCQPLNRIVILKPGSAGTEIMENKVQSERNASHFSFTEIKRKLKHVMGSRNLIIQRFPYGEKNGGWRSPNGNHFYTERFAKPCIGKPRDSERNLANETTGYPKKGVSKINTEAKKHLSEILTNDDEKELTSWQSPKTLGRILSLPEYNSPSCSPGRDREHSSVTAPMVLSRRSNFHMVNENTWRLVQENRAVHISPSSQESGSRSCINTNGNTDEKVQSPNSYPYVSDELNRDNLVEESLSSTRDEMSSEGVLEIGKTTDAGYKQGSKVLDVLCEPSSSSTTKDVQNCDTAEVCDEERSSKCLKLDSLEEDQLFSTPLVSSPSSSSVTRKNEDPESAIDRTGRPSPVSVLEPLFPEDDISPARTMSRNVVTEIQPLQIHFEDRVSSFGIRTCVENEESAFEYVEAVLLASCLNWDEFLLRWLSSDQLLDQSLFEEVELFSNRSSHDQKLLFDCTNEVLKEVCERYFGCPLVNHNIRPVPKGVNLINEVWGGIEWHLLEHPPPRSLDQLVRKDMMKSGEWMDLRFETEHNVINLGNSVLEELLDDTILGFVKDRTEGKFGFS